MKSIPKPTFNISGTIVGFIVGVGIAFVGLTGLSFISVSDRLPVWGHYALALIFSLTFAYMTGRAPGSLKVVVYGAVAGLAGGLFMSFVFFVVFLGMGFGGAPSWQIVPVGMLMLFAPFAGALVGSIVAIRSQKRPPEVMKATRTCLACGRLEDACNTYCTSCGTRTDP